MKGPNWFERQWTTFMWWWRRVYMPIFFKEFVMEMELNIDNEPGNIWLDPKGVRYIYMGKNMYAQMITGDEDEL